MVAHSEYLARVVGSCAPVRRGRTMMMMMAAAGIRAEAIAVVFVVVVERTQQNR